MINVCPHGSLARQCLTCEVMADLAELIAALRAYRIAQAVELNQATALAEVWRVVDEIDPSIAGEAEAARVAMYSMPEAPKCRPCELGAHFNDPRPGIDRCDGTMIADDVPGLPALVIGCGCTCCVGARRL